MTLNDGARAINRYEKFAILLFSAFAALIVVPALALIAVSIFSPGSIDLGH